MAELAKLVSPDYIGWMRTSAQATQAQAPIIDSVAVGRSRYEQITYEVAEQIATIALDRPSARNGYTSQMADELADAFERAGEDDQVRVVVLTAVGADFCVGADLKDMSVSAAADGQDESAWLEPASRAVRPLFRLEKPVIAAARRWRPFLVQLVPRRGQGAPRNPGEPVEAPAGAGHGDRGLDEGADADPG